MNKYIKYLTLAIAITSLSACNQRSKHHRVIQKGATRTISTVKVHNLEDNSWMYYYYFLNANSTESSPSYSTYSSSTPVTSFKEVTWTPSNSNPVNSIQSANPKAEITEELSEEAVAETAEPGMSETDANGEAVAPEDVAEGQATDAAEGASDGASEGGGGSSSSDGGSDGGGSSDGGGGDAGGGGDGGGGGGD